MYWDHYVIIYYSMWQAVKSMAFALTSRSNLFIGEMLFTDRYAEDLST